MIDKDCLPRETLKEYLAGWSAPDLTKRIESHLADCAKCEDTIVALEADPDTLVGLLQATDRSQPHSAIEDAVVLDAAKGQFAAQASLPPEPAAEHESWQPPADIGAYELLRPIGQGGMGSVYLARHRQLGRQVALKLLPAKTFRSDHFAARFQREIRAAGSLEHPAIVRATDAGEHAGTHYLVMEYIEGLDLSQIARLTGPLSVADACEIGRQIALGLSCAHAQGIVHRDIKPSNIMLAQSGSAKILDFGLARMGPWDECSAELTTVGQLMGTLDYMAPEQAEHADAVDFRADLYSLGATLFRLLCGRAPLAAAPDLSPIAKLRLLATHQPPLLDTLRPDAPRELVELLKSLLATDPNQRPASAAHVAEALREFAADHQLATLVERAERQKIQEPEPTSDVASRVPLAKAGSFNRPPTHAWASWLAWSLLLPLLALAGVWITLETQKGQVVIQSDASVSVALLKDGESYQQLKIVPGNNVTRLYAGKYQVRIEAGSDAVWQGDDQLLVKRGGTEVARISRNPLPADTRPPTSALESSASRPTNLSTPETTELMYEGQTLNQWLRVLAQERSPDSLDDTLDAIAALASPANSARITDRLLDSLPQLNPEIRIGPMRSDDRIFQVLRKVNPGPGFATMLVAELEGTRIEGTRLLQHAAYAREDYQPLLDWLMPHVLQRDDRPDLARATAGYAFLNSQAGFLRPADEARLLAALMQCPALDRAFWLNLEFAPAGGNFRKPNLSLLPKFVRQPALQTLADPTAPAALVAQAAMLLRAGDVSLNSEEQDQVAQHVRRHLAEYLSQGRLTKLVNLAPRFRSEKRIYASLDLPYPGLSVRYGDDDLLASTPMELLELATTLRLTDLSDQLSSIGDQTREGFLKVLMFWETASQPMGVEWPSFETPTVFRDDNSQVRPPTQADFVAYVLHLKSQSQWKTLVAKDESGTSDENASTTAEAAAPATPSETPSPLDTSSEVVYQGRPLSEWLEILPVEKSTNGVDETLVALRALVNDSNRGRVAAVLREVLPQTPWPLMQGEESKLYRSALSTLRMTDPDGYYPFLAEQLRSSDNLDWQLCLLQNGMLTREPRELSEIDEWIQSHEAFDEGPLLTEIVEFYRRRIDNGSADAAALMDYLRFLEVLDDEFWLTSIYSKYKSRLQGGELWMREVRQRAATIAADPAADASLFLIATSTLSMIERVKPHNLSVDWSQLSDAGFTRLKRILDEPDSLFQRIPIPTWSAAELMPSAVYPLRMSALTPGSLDLEQRVASLEILGALCVCNQSQDPNYREACLQLTQLMRREALDFESSVRTVMPWQQVLSSDFRRRRPPSTGSYLGFTIIPLFAGNMNFRIDLSQDRPFIDEDVVLEQAMAYLLFFRGLDGLEREQAIAVYKEYRLASDRLAVTNLIAEADLDQDASLSFDEFTTLAEQRPFEFVQLVPQEIDTNDDGQLDADELQRALMSTTESISGRDASRVRLTWDEMLAWAERTLAKYDGDNDGKLSEAEQEAMVVKPAAKADADGDGFLTPSEYAASRRSSILFPDRAESPTLKAAPGR